MVVRQSSAELQSQHSDSFAERPVVQSSLVDWRYNGQELPVSRASQTSNTRPFARACRISGGVERASANRERRVLCDGHAPQSLHESARRRVVAVPYATVAGEEMTVVAPVEVAVQRAPRVGRHRSVVAMTLAARECTSLPAKQVELATHRSLDVRIYQTRWAVPWNTLLTGLVWIIQIVSPRGGST